MLDHDNSQAQKSAPPEFSHRGIEKKEAEQISVEWTRKHQVERKIATRGDTAKT